MEQLALYHEDINDALRSAIKACGGTKHVAKTLWPEKTIADAQSYLNDCINPTRPAKLSPEQLIFLLKWARDEGFHGAMHYLCAESGYAAAQPIEPEDELAKMLREYIDIEKRRASLFPKIEEARLRVAK